MKFICRIFANPPVRLAEENIGGLRSWRCAVAASTARLLAHLECSLTDANRCLAADRDHDGTVAIDDIIAVAPTPLEGCSG